MKLQCKCVFCYTGFKDVLIVFSNRNIIFHLICSKLQTQTKVDLVETGRVSSEKSL